MIAAEPVDIERMLHEGGWLQDSRRAHRWSKLEAEIDVIPASEALLRAGSITWPDGFRMKLIGLAMALRTSTEVALDRSTSVRVAEIPALLLLKAAAYLDRPWERERDLEDIVAMLRDGIGPPETITRAVIDADIDLELACAFTLGTQLARWVDDAERTVMREFLAKARGASDVHQTPQRLARYGRWREDQSRARGRRAPGSHLRRGLRSRRAREVSRAGRRPLDLSGAGNGMVVRTPGWAEALRQLRTVATLA